MLKNNAFSVVVGGCPTNVKFCWLMQLLSSSMNVGWEVALLLLSSGKAPDSSFSSSSTTSERREGGTSLPLSRGRSPGSPHHFH